MKRDEIIQFLVERRTTDTLAGIVDSDLNLPLFYNNRHDALVIHIQTGHANGIK